MQTKKNFIPLLIIVLCLIYFPGCGEKESRIVTIGKTRVEIVLKNLLETRENEFAAEQLAICMWFSGHKHPLNMTATLEVAEKYFGKWKKEGGFQVIKSFTIDDAWLDDEVSHPTAIVEGTINGKSFQVSVPDSTMIKWEEIPR